MKKIMFRPLFLFVLCCFFATGSARATVIESGTFELFGLPDTAIISSYASNSSYTDPDTGAYVPVENYFGGIYESNSSGSLASITYGLNENDDYRGSGTYHASTITGQFHADTGSEEFALTAVSPDPGTVTAAVNVDFSGGVRFIGDITTIDFGYNYTFTGSKDDDDDSLSYVIQMEIEYWDAANHTYVPIYSDYGPAGLITDPTENYRNNWVFNSDFDGGNVSGSILFDFNADDFAADFNTDQYWSVRWDFMGNGRDTAGGGLPAPEPVPEPATLILFGSGLTGLAFHRRRRR